MVRLKQVGNILCCILSVAAAQPLYAKEVEVKELSIVYERSDRPGRDPLLQQIGQIPIDYVALQLRVEGLRNILFFDSTVHGQTTKHQFKTVGWDYKIGAQVGGVEIYWRHHSQHILDSSSPLGYPVYDSFGIKLKLIGN